LPKRSSYTLKPGHPTPGRHNLLRSPIAFKRGTGILTCFPSATAFALTLGADSPCADERCAGNLGLSASGPFTRFIATHVSIRTSDTSSGHHQPPSQAYRTLSYRACNPLNPLTSRASPLDSISEERFGLGRGFSRLTSRKTRVASSKRLDSLACESASRLRWIARTRSFGTQFEPR
jgi:hypothetical protein